MLRNMPEDRLRALLFSLLGFRAVQAREKLGDLISAPDIWRGRYESWIDSHSAAFREVFGVEPPATDGEARALRELLGVPTVLETEPDEMGRLM